MMQTAKLHEIIKEKNERLERDALRSAEQIIEAIAREQLKIDDANKNIAELRKNLHDLEVKQLDAKGILGE